MDPYNQNSERSGMKYAYDDNGNTIFEIPPNNMEEHDPLSATKVAEMATAAVNFLDRGGLDVNMNRRMDMNTPVKVFQGEPTVPLTVPTNTIQNKLEQDANEFLRHSNASQTESNFKRSFPNQSNPFQSPANAQHLVAQGNPQVFVPMDRFIPQKGKLRLNYNNSGENSVLNLAGERRPIHCSQGFAPEIEFRKMTPTISNVPFTNTSTIKYNQSEIWKRGPSPQNTAVSNVRGNNFNISSQNGELTGSRNSPALRIVPFNMQISSNNPNSREMQLTYKNNGNIRLDGNSPIHFQNPPQSPQWQSPTVLGSGEVQYNDQGVQDSVGYSQHIAHTANGNTTFTRNGPMQCDGNSMQAQPPQQWQSPNNQGNVEAMHNSGPIPSMQVPFRSGGHLSCNMESPNTAYDRQGPLHHQPSNNPQAPQWQTSTMQGNVEPPNNTNTISSTHDSNRNEGQLLAYDDRQEPVQSFSRPEAHQWECSTPQGNVGAQNNILAPFNVEDSNRSRPASGYIDNGNSSYRDSSLMQHSNIPQPIQNPPQGQIFERFRMRSGGHSSNISIIKSPSTQYYPSTWPFPLCMARGLQNNSLGNYPLELGIAEMAMAVAMFLDCENVDDNMNRIEDSNSGGFLAIEPPPILQEAPGTAATNELDQDTHNFIQDFPTTQQ